MARLNLNENIIQCDVLVIGGGIGGMQAAVSAAESGVSVVVAEKADTRRSGNGSTGNDHFACYMPEIHGDDFELVINETQDTMIGGGGDQKLLRTMLLNSEELVHKWESYGIPMHPFGKYLFEGHTLPTRQRYHLKFDGREQKPLLTKAAKSRGVKILNHITITELLTGDKGQISGAIGLDTSNDDPEFVVFQTKSAVIAAGGADTRLFPNGTPAYMFNVTHCPANACAAAIAFRAGARLINCDQLGRHASPRYFERSGKATWLGLVADINGKPVGDFVTKPSREYGDPLVDVWPGVFLSKMNDLSGPTYMDCTEMTGEDLEYMNYCFGTEGLSSLVDYFEQKNIKLKDSMIEFGSTGLRLAKGGIEIRDDASASIPGLYAAGNILGNVSGGVTCAAVYGKIAGENAAIYAGKNSFISVSENEVIKNKQKEYEAILEKDTGANWKEVNSTLAQIMQDYLGTSIKSPTMMQAGLKYLRNLREMAREELMAVNAHELMRTAEVIDLMDMGEAAFLSVMNRKESRGQFKRTDYKYTNPLLSGTLETIEKKDIDIHVDFRKAWHR